MTSPFFYVAVAINKDRLIGPGFKFKDSFYKYAINLVFQNVKPHLDRATVVLDRTGDKVFKSQLAKYLKAKINDKGSQDRIKKVKSEKSHTNNLVQMADMVCGAVAKSIASDKKTARQYRNLIRLKELRVQIWPPLWRRA